MLYERATYEIGNCTSKIVESDDYLQYPENHCKWQKTFIAT
jgi:hypothetical protein